MCILVTSNLSNKPCVWQIFISTLSATLNLMILLTAFIIAGIWEMEQTEAGLDLAQMNVQNFSQHALHTTVLGCNWVSSSQISVARPSHCWNRSLTTLTYVLQVVALVTECRSCLCLLWASLVLEGMLWLEALSFQQDVSLRLWGISSHLISWPLSHYQLSLGTF